MMRRTPRSIRQLLPPAQLLIKLLTLRLRTRILPVRTVRMAEGRSFYAALLQLSAQLLPQRLPAPTIQSREQLFGLLSPEDGAMLHPRTANSLHLSKLCTLLFQPLQNQIDGFEEHGDGREHLALVGVGKDTLLDAMMGEVGVEVDFGFVDEFEV